MKQNKQCEYYTMGYDGSNTVYIGEPKRDLRVCRFCGKSKPEVKFSKKAHALSESLGTKYIINNEECDTCNELFSGIEQDFYNRHAFHLTCFDVKGKNGSRKVKTDEINIFNHNGILTIENGGILIPRCTLKNKGKLDFSFLLKGYPHRPQNIYKCLVKYALSIIDSTYIKYFGETIKWIRTYNLEFKTLPKVLFYQNDCQGHPRIAYFIRKSDHAKFPFAFAAVEFAGIGYFFIIPLGNGEPITGYKEQNFKYTFKQIFDNRKFVEVDLVSRKKIVTEQRVEIDNLILNKTYFEISKEQFYSGQNTHNDTDS